MRCYFASPYRSHVLWPDRHHIIREAVLGMIRLHPLRIVWSACEIPTTDNVIWSPLPQGDMIRARLLDTDGKEPGEREMLNWCMYNLRNRGFDTLVLGASIPRLPDYGRNGMDREQEVAEEVGLRVVTDIELIHG